MPSPPTGSHRLVVLADFDGTLAPIVRYPRLARLPRRTRALLERLSRLPGVTVGIFSGRSLADLRRRVGLPRLVYAGNHGLELRGPVLSFRHPAAYASRQRLQRLAALLRRATREIHGSLIEWKGLTISAHWRGVAPRARPRFRRRVLRELLSASRDAAIRLTQGKCVLEIRPPVDWDKGAIVRWLAKRLAAGRGEVLWCYLGDDQTDEDAFRAVNRLGGLTIRVARAPRRTAATYRLSDPSAVAGWLRRLERCAAFAVRDLNTADQIRRQI